MTKMSAGSTWAKWDLHIHTPKSIVQHYGGDTPGSLAKFIDHLERLPTEVQVIGINDYYFIEGYEYVIGEKIRNGRLKNIKKVFPIVEYRVDTFGTASEHDLSKVNLHVLFDIDESNLASELKLIRDEFLGQIHLTKHHRHIPLSIENLIKHSSQNNLQSGFADLIPSTDEVLSLCNSDRWKDKVLVFLGYKEWDNLEKGNQLRLFKENLFEQADGFFTGSRTNAFSKKAENIARFGKKPLLHSLDIHSFQDLSDYECFTWIKADPTFLGLKKITIEESRIELGNPPKELSEESRKPREIISSITISATSDEQEWFDSISTIPLNRNLVAIIGNKGSGKSALADFIGAAGNCRNDRLSFLVKDKFLSSKAHKKYTITLEFNDGSKPSFKLTRYGFSESLEERVLYLSQTFVESLCDTASESKELQSQIDRVIFSHLPIEERLGQKDLPALVQFVSSEVDLKKRQLIHEIEEKNRQIIGKEKVVSSKNISSLTAKLDSMKLQLNELQEKGKPTEVKKPQDALSKRVEFLNAKYSEIESKIDQKRIEVQVQLIDARKDFKEVGDFITKATSLQSSIEEFQESISNSTLLIKESISKESVLAVRFNLDPLNTLKTKLLIHGNVLKKYSDKLTKLSEKIALHKDKFSSRLNGEQRKYQEYLKDVEKWNKKQKELIGEITTPETITYLQDQIRICTQDAPNELALLQAERSDLARTLMEQIVDKEKILSKIYQPTQGIADQMADYFKIATDDFIRFTSKIGIANKFENAFFEFINRNKHGTFYKTSSSKEFNKIVDDVVLEGVENYFQVPDRLVAALNHNLSEDPEGKDPKSATNIHDQLFSEEKKLDLYNYLYSFSYIEASFSFLYQGKHLSMLSPGERGMLLLIFFLLIDKSKLPIIIDQPEENLDNETVFKHLVKFIKHCKRERQIIIVTHNPNLAVVCDAEQIIYSSIDKQNGNRIKYETGSIENPEMKAHLIRILEGTKPAFDNRRLKYELGQNSRTPVAINVQNAPPKISDRA